MKLYHTAIVDIFGIDLPTGYPASRQSFLPTAYVVLTRETGTERENANA